MLNFYSIGIFESVVLDYPNMNATSQKFSSSDNNPDIQAIPLAKLLKSRHEIKSIDMKICPEWTINIITDSEDPSIEVAKYHLTNA